MYENGIKVSSIYNQNIQVGANGEKIAELKDSSAVILNNYTLKQLQPFIEKYIINKFQNLTQKFEKIGFDELAPKIKLEVISTIGSSFISTNGDGITEKIINGIWIFATDYAQKNSIINDKLNQLSTYGIMKDYSSKFIRDFIKVLIEYGYVSLRQGTYSMLQLNEKSYKILKSDLKVVLKLEADNEEKVLNNMLFNKLKLWRRDVAIQEGVKPYIIFSDATLIELCNKLPQNEEELWKMLDEIRNLIKNNNKKLFFIPE